MNTKKIIILIASLITAGFMGYMIGDFASEMMNRTDRIERVKSRINELIKEEAKKLYDSFEREVESDA